MDGNGPQQESSTLARLEGKVALITGAGSGIGRVTAEVFAREGARVAVAEIDKVSGEETAHLVEAAGGKAIFVPTDVTDPDSVEAAVCKAVATFGLLNVLHNNAGGSSSRDDSAVDVPLDEFWRTIRLDLFGTFLGCRFGIPALIRSGGGSVINMASSAAIMGQPRRDSYTAAKGAIVSITRSLAKTYGKDKVRVNAIVPAATRTPRVQKLIDTFDEVKDILEGQAFGIIEPADVALAAVYLASDESRMSTGSLLTVDGGVTIG
jgi:NAD(P)-dependent dehydrogenase (short-subunit alcohol dehydrogenase family)